MHIYFVLLIIIFLMGIIEVCGKKKDNLLGSILITFILLIFVGLKTQGGTDFRSYESIYEAYTLMPFSSVFSGFLEPFFLLLIIIAKIFHLGYYGFHFMIASINIPAKIYVFRKLVPYLYPALLMYVCGLLFERDNDGFRQGLSIAFCYLSLIPLLKGDKYKFIILNIVAVCIHYTSIIFFVLYYIKNIKWNDFIIFLIVVISFLCAVLNITVTQFIIQLIPIEAIVIKLQQYAQDESYSSSLGINIGVIFRVILLVLFILSHRKLKINDDLYYILRNGFAFAICISLLFSDFAILSHRLPYALRELQIFIVPYFMTIVKGKANKLLILSIIFLYSFIIIYRFLSGDLTGVYDYDNILLNIL